MKLPIISVIIPTLNEEGNIAKLTARIDAALTQAGFGYELIFIDDHSKDGTISEIEKASKIYPIRWYTKVGKQGKGYSVVEGFTYVQTKFTVIIDADLQYPPEAIPEMIKKILKNEADFIIGDRDERNLDFLRRFFSWGFKLFFGRLLHGLSGDVQSGLKVLRTQIIREVSIDPTPWAWDLELVLGAKDFGWRVDWIRILFANREAGKSSLNIIQAVKQIGWNAIKMKLRSQVPKVIAPVSGSDTIGAGIAKNGNRFITHSTLDYRISALQTFTLSQKLFIVSVVVVLGVSFYFYVLITTIVFMAILNSIYFADVLFNFFLVIKSLRNPPELNFKNKEISKLDDAKLPVYSILCPLFRESRVLPGFIQAIENLDWPKDKLDVLLLLEENDPETIDVAKSMDLPEYFRIIIVPHSLPKTKPKACNYGLALAKGEYLVIYDAEDIPDKDQLKKAYLGFQSVSNNIKCIQSKLNYFNSNQNILTKLFTSEYSLWFDVTLPGLQSINTFIPLGGTSNHFRTRDLITLKGWDPFNVTEDCDLGIRLFKLGYKTAILDSTTLEEANSNLRNWIRQRSRWIKGYMQTYLVHMRKPFEFFKKSPLHFMFFQFNVGGKIAFMLINPILWATTIGYFAFRPVLGPIIEQFYPSAVFYLAVFSLVFGNFLYLYCYMIGCAKREQWSLIKYVFLIPFYWLFMSVAALMAIYELIVRPHYWQKTNHGLNLAKNKTVNDKEMAIASPINPQK